VRAVALVLLAACGRISFDPSGDASTDATTDATTIDPDGGPSVNEVVELSAGGFNTCVRLGSGNVWCWGRGTEGGLGDGVSTDRGVPTKVPLSAPAIAIDTNDGGTYALHADGALTSWGWNNVGQLGVGYTGVTAGPERVADSNADLLGLGNQLGCIRRRTGEVACAGSGLHFGEGSNRLTFAGFLGTGSITVAALSGGDDFVCMLRDDGAVMCWGFNSSGAFGDNSTTPSAVPTLGPAGPYAVISAGDLHVCAIRAPIPGTVDCWGRGASGELGDGTFVASRPFAMSVPGLTDIIGLAGFSSGTCALHATGTVDCWGGWYGLGDGTTVGNNRGMPAPAQLTDVAEISAQTGLHVCARKRDNTVWCWGENVDGQLGRGDASGNALLPVQVVGLPAL
jgi:alpha-tubulin suppressor-like RCC1 family protein